ncbi:1-acyl-sn-glycerol-3-phosphate acyltransferase [Legionella sp.]|uniref:1-acyl-sn-glycerol-3-phosphate acyltransferase n=1 Tax=Legionella sp. TaxID=459 RepID=UPI003CAD4139
MQKFGTFFLKLFGWKVVGNLPTDKKYIVIVAPHTSNWDFPIGLFARFSQGVKIHFLAKDQLFFFPLGLFLRAVGGTPIDRSQKNNNVEKVVELFSSRDDFKLAITPEGTRSAVTRWKEGFYHIACKAKLPLVMVALDYPSKEVRIREAFWPSGDITKDFPQVLDYYRKIAGCYPKKIPEYSPPK